MTMSASERKRLDDEAREKNLGLNSGVRREAVADGPVERNQPDKTAKRDLPKRPRAARPGSEGS